MPLRPVYVPGAFLATEAIATVAEMVGDTQVEKGPDLTDAEEGTRPAPRTPDALPPRLQRVDAALDSLAVDALVLHQQHQELNDSLGLPANGRLLASAATSARILARLQADMEAGRAPTIRPTPVDIFGDPHGDIPPGGGFGSGFVSRAAPKLAENVSCAAAVASTTAVPFPKQRAVLVKGH